MTGDRGPAPKLKARTPSLLSRYSRFAAICGDSRDIFVTLHGFYQAMNPTEPGEPLFSTAGGPPGYRRSVLHAQIFDQHYGEA
jgi:hypothetical protein